MVATGTVR